MLKQKVAQKTKLSQTMRSWLPILQVPLEELEDTLKKMGEENPFLEFGANKNYQKSLDFVSNSSSEVIESRAVSKKNVFEHLSLQIIPPLFPTPKTQEIATGIISCLNNEGYFEYDESVLGKYDIEDVERIRERFRYLDPVGVGAKDQNEAFLFALDGMDLEDELYSFTKALIKDLANIANYTKNPLYKDALGVIKKFQTPPFIDYLEESAQIIPDIFIFQEDGEIKIRINDEYYPSLDIATPEFNHEFLQGFIKDAKNMVDALSMRKATLQKIGLMIVEYQYDFFMGGDIKPMRLQDLAIDLERNASTISRAISNKYLSCNRGLIPLKSFFATALDDGEVSNAAIKEHIQALIREENRLKPLSDIKILESAQKKFPTIKLVRRTITKYRQQMGVESSSARKKLYELSK